MARRNSPLCFFSSFFAFFRYEVTALTAAPSSMSSKTSQAAVSAGTVLIMRFESEAFCSSGISVFSVGFGAESSEAEALTASGLLSRSSPAWASSQAPLATATISSFQSRSICSSTEVSPPYPPRSLISRISPPEESAGIIVVNTKSAAISSAAAERHLYAVIPLLLFFIVRPRNQYTVVVWLFSLPFPSTGVVRISVAQRCRYEQELEYSIRIFLIYSIIIPLLFGHKQ